MRGHRGPGGADRDPAVYFAWDLPFSNGPNAGFMLWRGGAQSRRLLNFWWNLDAGSSNGEHDYEQHALHWTVAHLPTFRGALETLQLESMTADAGWKRERHAARLRALPQGECRAPAMDDGGGGGGRRRRRAHRGGGGARHVRHGGAAARRRVIFHFRLLPHYNRRPRLRRRRRRRVKL